MKVAQALQAHPDFSTLDAEDREILGKAFTLEEHAAGHHFITQGERPGAAWLILEGEVAVTRLREPYIDELGKLSPGDLFGLVSLVSGVRRTATCRGVGPTTTARMDKFALDQLMRSHGPVALALQRAVARQLAADYRQVARQLHETLDRRG